MPQKRVMRILFLMIFCLIYIAAYPRPCEVYRLKLFYNAKVLFYADSLPQNYNSCEVTNNGINYELKTDLINAYKIRDSIDVKYQTVIFEGNIDYVLRYLKIQIRQNINFNGGILIHGYCPQIKGNVAENGVNIQIFAKEGDIYIGNPVIFGSF